MAGFSNNSNDFSDIDQFARDYDPDSQGGGFDPGPELIPEGVYDFQIVKAELTKTAKTMETIFKLHLIVLGGPYANQQIVRPTFFKHQIALDSLGADMVVLLGPVAREWSKRGKAWSQELLEACPHLAGKRFRAERKNGKPRPGETQGFPNLYIRTLITNAGPAPAGKPAPQQPARPMSSTSTDKSVPF